METCNYHYNVLNDVKNYIEGHKEELDFSDLDTLREELNDTLWTNDSVTGNGCGSYTLSTWQAEENICHNLDLLAEACEGFGGQMDILEEGAEACDVTIRCYLLSQCIDEALEDYEEENEQ